MFETLKIPSQLIPQDPRFTAGPSLVPVEHLKKLAETGVHLLGTSHRKDAVRKVVKNVQNGLLKYFGLSNDYLVVMGNGGATLLFDMIGLGAVESKSLHFTCGEFSSKWHASHALIPWIQTKKLNAEFGKSIKANVEPGFDTICMTLNETSTGVQNTYLPEVDAKTLLCVDATSGAGQVPCDVTKVDIFFFSPQKVFASEGGLFVAILSPKAKERVLKIAQDKTRYIPEIMNFKQAIENAEKNQTYNTPSISTLYLLMLQIDEMNKFGYAKVQQMAQEKAQVLYKWAEEKAYLSCYVQDSAARSTAVATIDVDKKINVDDLIKKLETEKIVYGIDSYRKLERNQFRISFFHNILLSDVKKLTELLSFCIEQKL